MLRDFWNNLPISIDSTQGLCIIYIEELDLSKKPGNKNDRQQSKLPRQKGGDKR
jgi:hypothetical protein